MSFFEVLGASGCIFIGFVIANLIAKLGVPRKKVEEDVPPQPQFFRVAGRVIDKRDWSPEVLAEIKKDYFVPAVTGGIFVRYQLSGQCPEKHMVIEKIGILVATGQLNTAVSDALIRGRASLRCGTCGKPASATGKTVVWQGTLSAWDGAT